MTTQHHDPAQSPNATLMMAAGTALFGLLFLFLSITWADPDLWGHVKFGGDIASSGLHARDDYSFGSDRPWVNHEWLAELLMYGAWASAGGTGLIALKTAVALLTVGAIHLAIARVSMSATLHVLLLFTAVAGMWPRVYVVRPQIFSLVLFATLLLVLHSAERLGEPPTADDRRPATRRLSRLWLLPPLFALWVNLHGGWIVGLAAAGLWLAAELTPFRAAAVPPVQAVAIALLSVLATLLNPYGIGMWEFLGETVRLGRTNIADWQPLVNTGAGKIAAWGTAATLATLALVQGGRRTPLAHAVLTIGLGLAALRVSRLDAFFAIAVVMLLAPHIAAFAEGTRRGRSAAGPAPRRIAAMAIVGGFVALLVRPDVARCIRLDAPWMPERSAAPWIAAQRLNGRLLTWFDWGQYAIWHFAPSLRVSFDGRRETVYSAEYLQRHTDLYFLPESERDFLESLDADYAWLKRDIPLAGALERAGWTRVFDGPVSVVLSRRPIDSVPGPEATGPACFPGP